MSAPHRTRPLTPWRALIALFCVAVIWGATFVWMKQAVTTAAEKLGPGTETSAAALFLALRFGAAAVIVVCISRASRRALRRGSRAEWRAGLWLGFLLILGFGLQMRGLEDVSPAVSAFLTSLYVLFTALLSAIKGRRGLRTSLAIGSVLATIGAGLVRGRPELHFTTGEWLTIASALVFAVHILATDRLTRVVAPMPVTLTMFATVALGSLFVLGACAAGGGVDWERVGALLSLREYLIPLALTTTLATVVALSLMNVYQREIDPVRAAILYAFEPIFALFFGLWAGLDTLTGWLWVGGAMILLGNLIAELGVSRTANSTATAETSGTRPAA